MSNATLIGRAVVNSLGHVVRVVVYSGQRWAVARDIALCVLLQAGAVGARIALHPEVFAEHYRKARIEGHPAESLLLSEEGIRLFVAGMKSKPQPDGVESDLIAWLDAGGLNFDQPPAAPEIETLPVEEAELLPPPRHVPSLRLVPRGPDPMQQLLEREKAYCRDLVKTLLRYCESEDVDKLTGMVEGQIDHLLESRYCPGLNAACYELYRKYWLQGGEA